MRSSWLSTQPPWKGRGVPEQFRQLQELLRLWRLRAAAYSGPGYEERLAADPGFGSSSAGATLTVERAALTGRPHGP